MRVQQPVSPVVKPSGVPRRTQRAATLDIDINTDVDAAASASASPSAAPASLPAPSSPAALRQAVDRRLTTSVRVEGHGPAAVTRLRHLNLQQLAALEVSGQPMRLCNALSHPDAVFVFTLVSGRCTLSCEAGTLVLQGGQCVVLRGDRTMTAVHSAPFLLRGTRVPAAQLQREMADWQHAELLPMDSGSGPAALLCALQDQLLTNGQALGNRSADAFVGTMACLLADALRAVRATPSDAATPNTQAEHHKRRIRAHVRAHLGDADLDVATVAAGVGLSPAHLHRLFSAEPMSLRAWIQAQRLEACHAALQDPAQALRAVTDIALAWGFRSPAHFSRSFKLRFGVAPRALRQAVRRSVDQATGTTS